MAFPNAPNSTSYIHAPGLAGSGGGGGLAAQGVVVKKPEEFGAVVGNESVDCGLPTREALAAARKLARERETFAYAVELSVGTYNWLHNPIGTAGEYKGNSICGIPIDGSQEPLCWGAIIGAGAVPGPWHWAQTQTQKAGTIIKVHQENNTSDPTYKVPSVIGGPTIYEDPHRASLPSFSNTNFITKGFSIQLPHGEHGPAMIGVDMRQILKAERGVLAGFTDLSPTYYNESTAHLPTAADGIFYYSPLVGNGVINGGWDPLTTEGWSTALVFSEHHRAYVIPCYANVALIAANLVNKTGTQEFQGSDYPNQISAVVTACKTAVLECVGAGEEKLRFAYLYLSAEASYGTYDIIDASDELYGKGIWHRGAGETPAEPRKSGGTNLTLETL